MQKKNVVPLLLLLGLVLGLAGAFNVPSAEAHGERTQSPFLRMRTVLYHDTHFSTKQLKVNEELVITGKFRIFEDWPESIHDPELAYLNVGIPGPRFIKTNATVNGVFANNGFRIVQGGDYEYKLVLKARRAGTYHVHPMLNVKGVGPVVGPGQTVKIESGTTGFRNDVKLLNGDVKNLEVYGIGRVGIWHAIWSLLGFAWIGYWLFFIIKQTLLRRAIWAATGKESALLTPRDMGVGLALFIVSVMLIGLGFIVTNRQYDDVIPLQTTKPAVDPLPKAPQTVEVKFNRSTYEVLGRTVTLNLEITNKGNKEVQIGEFNTANIRFLDRDLPFLQKELEFEEALALNPKGPIAAGETKAVQVIMTSPLWNTQRLTAISEDPESRLGGLLTFYDSAGNPIAVVSVGGTLFPIFT